MSFSPQVIALANTLVAKHGHFLTSRLTEFEIYSHVEGFMYAGEKKMEEFILESVRYRYSYFYRNLLTMNFPEEELANLSPIYIHGTNKKGNPLIWERFDILEHNASQIRGQYSLEKYVIYRHIMCKRIDNLKKDISVKTGTPVHFHTCIFDVQNVGISSIYDTIDTIRATCNITRFYPEQCTTAYIINAGAIFTFSWRIFKPLLRNQHKVKILGEDYLSTLLEDIDIDQIPQCYGGNCQIPLTVGQIYIPGQEITRLYPESLIEPNTEYIYVPRQDNTLVNVFERYLHKDSQD